MPIKSTGCATCRKRKIRCDETRPGCNRCKTHNVPCPGYRLPAKGEVAFQDDTQLTVVNAHKAYKTKAPTEYTFQSVSPISGSKDAILVSATETWSLSDGDFEFNFSPQQSPLESMALIPTPHYLPSPAAEKALIYSTFIDTYLPKARGIRDSHFSFLEHVISTPGLRDEVADSLDALSMVQVGTMYSDKALLRQAVRAYSKSLNGLVRTLGSKRLLHDDYVLATVTMLANCEFYDEIAQMGSGWSKHILGGQQLMAARGPDSIRSELSLLVYSNMRHAALSHALIARKACFMGTPEWRAVAFRVPNVDEATLLYDTALQVPAVLERADNLDSESPNFISDLDDILRDAVRLSSELRAWFDGYDKQSKFRNPQDESLFWLTKVSNFPVFVGLCADRTLKEGYMFPSFMVGYLLSVYWNTLHFVQTTVQKLHIKRYEVSQDWLPGPDEAVTEDELMGYAMKLCQCFPFFCEPISSSTGKIAIFLPLRTASMYFVERGHWQMLKWIANFRDSIFNGGLQPPRVSPNASTIATIGQSK